MTNQPDSTKVYYFASPFSTPMPEGTKKDQDKIKQLRHHHVEQLATYLYNSGYTLIEPIASSYYKAVNFKVPATYEYWKARDRKLVEVSDGVIVAGMPGWSESIGVTDEIKHAKELGKPVYLLRLDWEGKVLGFYEI